MIIEKLRHVGLKISKKQFVYGMIIISFILSLAITCIGYYFNNQHLAFTFITAFACNIFLFFSWLNLKVTEKAEFVEGILPDVLDLTAANLKAGMTTDKALLLAAKPEFGSFKDDLYEVGEEMTLGIPLPQALLKLKQKVKSEKLNKIIQLIISGYTSGGKLSPLLIQASRTLKKKQILEGKIRATVVSYIAFITIIIVIGAPFLFATSTFLIDSLSGIMSNIEAPISSKAMSFSITNVSVSSDIVIPFVIIMLITTSIMGSFVIGQIKNGKVSEGTRYIPFFIIFSIMLFYLTRWILNAVFTI